MSGRGSSGAGSSSRSGGSSSSSKAKGKKKSSSSSSSAPKSAPVAIPRPHVPSKPIPIPRDPRTENYVPLSTSFTHKDIMRSQTLPDSFYPKVGDNESVNSLNGDFKFIPPHIIAQREREKEMARSYDKHKRRHQYY